MFEALRTQTHLEPVANLAATDENTLRLFRQAAGAPSLAVRLGQAGSYPYRYI